MFDHHDLLRLQKTFSEFSLDRMCRTTNTDLPALYHYLEFYGFLYTLKGLSVEYYCGYRTPEGEAGRWGRIATHYWRLSEARGTVFVVHGLFDHVGLYQPAVRYLLDQGYSVVAIDLPGHGLSDGEATVIDSFDSYADVLAECVAYFESRMQGPAYGLGQSTGGAVVLNHCFRAAKCGDSCPYQAIILLAPLLRSVRWRWVNMVYRAFSPIIRSINRSFVTNSHNESFNHFLATSDILQSRRLSVRWVTAMREWAFNFDQQPKLDVPALLVQGTGDRVVDWRFNVPAFCGKLSNVEQLQIDKAMHHLVNESPEYRRPLVKAVGVFLANHAASGADASGFRDPNTNERDLD
ncbi:alpha/beta hydrolase [Marinagarivorans cellulosilyticus]|uniref:Lysophospholipase n=1 Tax=Marinagarivorans cellulosilyticus TaxID=2721545 RepID=A0AAN1WHB7_9GAMM|nr:alpha/beta fold hydrolase [Marinagarivorans cellulosilyticus]BCD97615.1 lysophospholipase [Marinagarivorans cellulosilyticus]